jgi:hypothetical protein
MGVEKKLLSFRRIVGPGKIDAEKSSDYIFPPACRSGT